MFESSIEPTQNFTVFEPSGTDDDTTMYNTPSESIAEEKLGGVVKTPSQKVVYPPNTDYTKGHDPYREPIE